MRTNKDCWYINVCTRENCNSCMRFLEMNYLMSSSGIPKSQQIPKQLRPTTKHDMNQFKILDSIKQDIVNFVESGQNIYISSVNVGTSKTSWAIKLMLRFFDEIWSGNGLRTRGLFIHVPSFLQSLKDFNNPLPEEYREDIKECDLVIWDDIATMSKLTDYEYSQLLIYLDHRILNDKSNIYTSNVVSKKDLDQVLGVRLASRVLSEKTHHIVFTGNDARGVTMSTSHI